MIYSADVFDWVTRRGRQRPTLPNGPLVQTPFPVPTPSPAVSCPTRPATATLLDLLSLRPRLRRHSFHSRARRVHLPPFATRVLTSPLPQLHSLSIFSDGAARSGSEQHRVVIGVVDGVAGRENYGILLRSNFERSTRCVIRLFCSFCVLTHVFSSFSGRFLTAYDTHYSSSAATRSSSSHGDDATNRRAQRPQSR